MTFSFWTFLQKFYDFFISFDEKWELALKFVVCIIMATGVKMVSENFIEADRVHQADLIQKKFLPWDNKLT